MRSPARGGQVEQAEAEPPEWSSSPRRPARSRSRNRTSLRGRLGVGFTYLDRSPAGPLSVLMRSATELHRPDVVMPWLDNLLPDDDVRARWAAQFGERCVTPFNRPADVPPPRASMGPTRRIHREDLGQSLGLRRTMKDQADGGPSARTVVELLQRVLDPRDRDRGVRDFVRRGVPDHRRPCLPRSAPGHRRPRARRVAGHGRARTSGPHARCVDQPAPFRAGALRPDRAGSQIVVSSGVRRA